MSFILDVRDVGDNMSTSAYIVETV